MKYRNQKSSIKPSQRLQFQLLKSSRFSSDCCSAEVLCHIVSSHAFVSKNASFYHTQVRQRLSDQQNLIVISTLDLIPENLETDQGLSIILCNEKEYMQHLQLYMWVERDGGCIELPKLYTTGQTFAYSFSRGPDSIFFYCLSPREKR